MTSPNPSRRSEIPAEVETVWCALCRQTIPADEQHDCPERLAWMDRLRSDDEFTGASSRGRTAAFEVAHAGSIPAAPASMPGSSNGRTAGSDPADEGSTPSPGSISPPSSVLGAPPLAEAGEVEGSSNSADREELALRDGGLLAIEKVAEALERCVEFDEFRDVRDTAVLLKGLLRERKASLASQNRLAEVRLRAERRMGEILRALKIRRGRKSAADPVDVNPALAEIQVTEKESAIWQRLARIDQAEWDKRIADALENGIELRTSWMFPGKPPASMQSARDLADAAEKAQGNSCRCVRIEDCSRCILQRFTREEIERLGRIAAGGAAKDEREAEEVEG